jgi:branched-chain amino acid transport system ATP-binding protein
VLADEPSLGLAPNIVERTFEIIKRVREEGTTVLMVKQNALRRAGHVRSGLSLRVRFAHVGGTGKQMMDDPHIRGAYFGA